MKRNRLTDCLARPFLTVVAYLVFRLKVTNRKIIPKTGGIIIAGNHISDWDPPFVGVSVPRGVHFMAKSELFKNPIIGSFLGGLGAFPVYRKSAVNRDALNTAADIVNRGNALIIFPEGTRSKTVKMLPPKPGVGYVAHSTGAPVYPFYVSGTESPAAAAFFRTRFRVRFGEPIAADTLEGIHASGGPAAVATHIMEQVKRIKEEEERTKGKKE